MKSPDPGTATMIKATAALGGIFFLRMFGLFLLIPVLSLYAIDLDGATPLLVGLALGIYGLTQGLLQIPLGMLSDRAGRKPVILGGLCLFIAGSLIATMGDHILAVILGRALQGAGAIAAAVMALLADITPEHFRTRAMAGIGMSVGMAFILAMVLGPVFAASFGLDGLFYIGAGLAILAVLLLVFIKAPPVSRQRGGPGGVSGDRLLDTISNPGLARFNLGVLFLHMILMASFVALPLMLREFTLLENSEHWHVYLPVLLASVIIMLPMIIHADRKQGSSPDLAAVILLMASQLGLAFWHETLATIAAGLLLFFVAFNYLEAVLPATISKAVDPETRGTALGVFTTCQFIGAFLGGICGGLGLKYLGYDGVFILNVLVSVAWLGSLLLLKSARVSTRLDHLQEN